MAGTAPIVTGRETRGFFWIREVGDFHTRVNIAPSNFTRQTEERYLTVLRFFKGQDEPHWEFHAPEYGFYDPLHLEMRDVLTSIGVGAAEGLLELTNFRVTPEGFTPYYMEIWLDFYREDWSTSFSIPAVPVAKVGGKTIQTSGFGVLPGIICDDTFTTHLLILNNLSEDAPARLLLFAPTGEHLEEEIGPIPYKDMTYLELEAVFTEARDFLAPHGGVGSLLLRSAVKLVPYMLFQNRKTCVITGMDHSVGLLEVGVQLIKPS